MTHSVILSTSCSALLPYRDAPELEDALRELRLAIKTGDQHTIDIYQERAVNVIDSTLRYSGYRSHG